MTLTSPHDEPAPKLGERGTITISHSRAEGTLATGGAKGDGSGEILKSYPQRFTWFRTLGCWGIRNSRDKQASTWKIQSAATALRAAGFTVLVEIDEDTARPFAEAEADRVQRAEDRAERFQTYADNAGQRSDARYQAGRDMLGRIPFGQPILVGHHSEGADRRYRNRAVDHLDKSVEEDRKSEHWQHRADAAASYQAGREHVGTTLRRIAKLEADERFWANTLKTGRNSAGWTTNTPDQVQEINRRLADVREQLEHWRAVITAAEQAGHRIWSKSDFTKGDFALSRGRWHQVMRVNAKSVTVPYLRDVPLVLRADDPGFLWTATIPYNQIDGRKTAQEIAEAEQRATTSQDDQTT